MKYTITATKRRIKKAKCFFISKMIWATGLKLLHIVKTLIVSVFSQKRVVSAALHYAPLVKHTNLVGVLYGGKSVGYGNGCAGFISLSRAS